MSDSKMSATDASSTRFLLACGVVGPTLFAIVYTVLGATQPGYRAWHHTISTLALGELGWVQSGNFILSGVFHLAFATGLGRALAGRPGSTWGPRLFFIIGLGLLVIGVAASDPILGYPVGAPTITSTVGTIHDLTSLTVFLALAAVCFVLSRTFGLGWSVYSALTGIAAIVIFGLFFASVSAARATDDGTAPTGLLERLPTLLVGVWQTILTLRLVHAKTVESSSAIHGRR